MQKSDSPGVAGLVASMLVIGLTLAGATALFLAALPLCPWAASAALRHAVE